MENLQPKLRFPEFKDNWKDKKLNKFANITAGGTPSTTKNEYWNGNIPWMNSGELNLKHVFDVNARITDLGLQKSSTKLIPKYSVLIGLAGQGKTRGTCAINHIELCTNQSIASILPNDEFNSFFLYYNLDFRYNELRRLSSGDGGRGGLNLSLLKNLIFHLPNIQEQTKIADFLGSVDKQLDILNQKKEKLNLYKKGVMQQLFSQQIRFKDDNGNDFPDWEEKNINDVFSFRQGIQCELNQQYLIRNKNQYRFIRIIDLTNENEPPRYIYHENKNDIIQESDLFMVRYGSPGMVGYGYRGIIANNLFRLIPNQNVNTLFYKYQFNFLYKEIISLSSSTSMPAISFKSLNNLKVVNPSIEEQTKIANFLSAIDKQIEAVENQITKTETYKKGLLQQMFV